MHEIERVAEESNIKFAGKRDATIYLPAATVNPHHS